MADPDSPTGRRKLRKLLATLDETSTPANLDRPDSVLRTNDEPSILEPVKATKSLLPTPSRTISLAGASPSLPFFETQTAVGQVCGIPALSKVRKLCSVDSAVDAGVLNVHKEVQHVNVEEVQSFVDASSTQLTVHPSCSATFVSEQSPAKPTTGRIPGLYHGAVKLTQSSQSVTLIATDAATNFSLTPINNGPTLELNEFLHVFPEEMQSFEGDAAHHASSDLYSELDSEPEESVQEGSGKKPTAALKDLLFLNSDLSVESSLLAILSYAVSARLSGRDFHKLLELLHLLLPKPNKLPSSKHVAFKMFEHDDSKLQVVFYCNKCWKFRSSGNDKCDKCKGSKINYFINCPLLPQLQKIYSRPGFLEKIKYKSTRQKENTDNIEDVYDSAIYKEFEELLTPPNCSLTWYTDGISIFECSSYSLWPFIFVINELPPNERYKPENILIGCIWGDTIKPHPNMFLLPLFSDIVKLREGFPVKLFNSPVETTVKSVLLFGACDSPAKASFMNMKLYSGFHSCPKCLIRGEKSVRTGNVMVFPYEENLTLRSDANYENSVVQAVREKTDCNGVMGPSILSYMTYSSFVRSVSIDSMHALFLGITKQLLKLWFNPKYKDEPFSLSKHTDAVNNVLKELKLPHFVQRLPEDVTKLGFWKASLCRNFLLYIALVVLRAPMKPEYYENLMLLVDGASLLNKSSISQADRLLADQKLKNFCKSFEHLYGVRHMSSNIHLLLHLAQSVADTGNLCLTNCFPLEDLLGKLSALVHGTLHAPKQIYRNLLVLSELPLLISKTDSVEVKDFYWKVTKHSKYLNLTEKIGHHAYVVGEYDIATKHVDKLRELMSLFPVQVEFRTFPRLYQHKYLFVSSSYGLGSRLSSFCAYKTPTGIGHGEILTFVKTLTNPVKFYALISKSDDLLSGMDRYFLFNSIDDLDLVCTSSLKCVSFCNQVKEYMYIVDPLNSFELE